MKTQTKRAPRAPIQMQVPTCTDCGWQLIPDGDTTPLTCPDCDSDRFEMSAERTDSETVTFTVGVLKAMLATVPEDKWTENADQVTTILRAMAAVRS